MKSVCKIQLLGFYSFETKGIMRQHCRRLPATKTDEFVLVFDTRRHHEIK
jgi:hypothetical protein